MSIGALIKVHRKVKKKSKAGNAEIILRFSVVLKEKKQILESIECKSGTEQGAQ